MEVFIFIFWICVSMVPGIIAHKKGRSFIGFFLLSLLLSPIVGLVAVWIAKPNIELAEKRQMVSGNLKKCPDCAELIKREAAICRFCGKKQPELIIKTSGTTTTDHNNQVLDEESRFSPKYILIAMAILLALLALFSFVGSFSYIPERNYTLFAVCFLISIMAGIGAYCLFPKLKSKSKE